MDKELEQVHQAIIETYYRSFGGVSALDIARAVKMSHEEVIRCFEQLAKIDMGTLKRDVVMGLITLNLEKVEGELEKSFTEVKTHIYFPKAAVLKKEYYKSSIPETEPPEFTERLYKGALQYGFSYFKEEVLARYHRHPELYQIEDSVSGGRVMSKEQDDGNAYTEEGLRAKYSLDSPRDPQYLFVRYGKATSVSGGNIVIAVNKDLSSMSPLEQHYWAAHETPEKFQMHDPNFNKFFKREFMGEFVDYFDPIKDISKALNAVNESSNMKIYRKVESPHVHLPVEQTYKAYCDCASEIYKLVGPDNINMKCLKLILSNHFKIEEIHIIHDSGRPFSTLQLLSLLEVKLGYPLLCTGPIEKIKHLRMDADHKILTDTYDTSDYSQQFTNHCEKLAKAHYRLAQLLANIEGCAV